MAKHPNPYFRFIRWCASLIRPAEFVQNPADVDAPCVFVCRHRNMSGPIYSMIYMCSFSRPWVYYPFCDRKEFARQMREYTLTQRLHWPRWLAKVAAPVFAVFVVPLIRALGSIPVYRNDGRIRETFRQSLEALEAGERLIIYPDIEYTSKSEDVGDVYEGFFMLERMYFRKTGRHIPFVPVHLDMEGRRITYGAPVRFGDGNFNAEKELARAKLIGELNGQEPG